MVQEELHLIGLFGFPCKSFCHCKVFRQRTTCDVLSFGIEGLDGFSSGSMSILVNGSCFSECKCGCMCVRVGTCTSYNDTIRHITKCQTSERSVRSRVPTGVSLEFFRR